jgi:NRAMP (natural resistance-associated macrophage protein)-like metal ion transporter
MKLSLGPGTLVAAAFIGPGTVTTATVAGANTGFALVWVLVFATLATIIFQEMAARLGVVGQLGLGEAMVSGLESKALKWSLIGLVLSALVVGNAAYEAGNIAGGALGLDALFSASADAASKGHVLVIGTIAGSLLLWGKYKVLERALIGLVILMSLAFTLSFITVRPDLGAFFGGWVPTIPNGELLRVVALIGTTIVPYNLFLHAAAVRNRWQNGADDLPAAIGDTRLSIGLGGLVSIFILSTAAATLFANSVTVTSAGEMALALEPIAGERARILIGLGLFAAGLTSAITAPMATAYAVTELVPAFAKTKAVAFRVIALGILAIGLSVSLLGLRPIELILFAQMTNGLLLPIIAGFLLYAMNRRSLLGAHINGPVANMLGGGVLLITLLLGARLVLRTFGVWP